MTALRTFVPLFASLLLLGQARPEDRLTEAADVTADFLWKNSEKYHGKRVRLTGVVERTPEAREREQGKGGFAYRLDLAGDAELDISITCEGKPAVVKGDRVRVTGTFAYLENSFVRRRLAVGPPHGKVEKVAEEKPEAEKPVAVTLDELGGDRKKYHGKLVRVEVTVPEQVLVSEKGDRSTYAFDVGKEQPVHLLCPGKPDCKAGDRLRVTGRFDYLAPSFARLRIDATAAGGRVEKLPATKE